MDHREAGGVDRDFICRDKMVLLFHQDPKRQVVLFYLQCFKKRMPMPILQTLSRAFESQFSMYLRPFVNAIKKQCEGAPVSSMRHKNHNYTTGGQQGR